MVGIKGHGVWKYLHIHENSIGFRTDGPDGPKKSIFYESFHRNSKANKMNL
jgi:hypothetical protein